MALGGNVIAVVILFIVSPGQCHGPLAISEVCLKVPSSVDDCYAESLNQPISRKAAKVDCLQRMLWNLESDKNLTAADLNYFSALSKSNWRYGHPHSKTGKRTRQEYRTLTDTQRNRLHIAFQKLYQKRVIEKYALLHRLASRYHYRGASFLPWNRVFLTFFEEELRLVDKTVALPYLDLSLDERMGNPVNSVLWSKELLGNANGDVVTGFAKKWKTIRGNLWRRYGRRGKLINKKALKKIYTRCHNDEISFPLKMPENEAELECCFEYHRNGFQNWIGGDMSDIDMAAFDPVFYMVHAGIDMKWEKFRFRQKSVCRVNPETDYPVLTGGGIHGPNDYMIGFDGLKNIDGLQNYWNDIWYNYEESPQCKTKINNCRSKYLYCRNAECVSHSRRTDYNPGQYHKQYLGRIPEPFEPIASYVPKRTGSEFKPSPLNDGRTAESAERDARIAMSISSKQPIEHSLYQHTNSHASPQHKVGIPQSRDIFISAPSQQKSAVNRPSSVQRSKNIDLTQRLAEHNKLIRQNKLIQQGSRRIVNQLRSSATGIGYQVKSSAVGNGDRVRSSEVAFGNQVRPSEVGIGYPVRSSAIGSGNQARSSAIGSGNQARSSAIGSGKQARSSAIGSGNQARSSEIVIGNQARSSAIGSGKQARSSTVGIGYPLRSSAVSIQKYFYP